MPEPDSHEVLPDQPQRVQLHLYAPDEAWPGSMGRRGSNLWLRRTHSLQMDAGQVRLNGQLHMLLYWSAQSWEETPEQERPMLGVIRGIEGGRFCLVPVEP